MLDTYRRFISAPELLAWYKRGLFAEDDSSTAYNDLFVLARRERKHLPDYYHELQLNEDLGDSELSVSAGIIRELLLKSYKKICSRYLMSKNKRIYAKSDNFELWQDLLTYCNSIPALAYHALSEAEDSWEKAWEILAPALAVSTIPICFNPLLDQMGLNETWRAAISIDRQGNATDSNPPATQERSGALYELHMHLNGTSEADIVWLHSLNEPEKVYGELQKAFKEKRIRRFYRQFHLESPEEIYYRLLLARWLQRNIAEFVVGRSCCGKRKNTPNISLDMLKRTISSALACSSKPLDDRDNPGSSHPLSYSFKIRHLFGKAAELKNKARSNIQDEGLMMTLAFSALKEGDSFLPLLLHCYILLSSQFTQITVQQKSQIGFAQFQHLTEIGVRENMEKNYGERFKQLIGMYGPHLNYLEGRFAPKDSLLEIEKIIHSIVTAYDEHIDSGASNNMRVGQLALVAHFIKKRDENSVPDCRHNELRKKSERCARSLIQMCLGGINQTLGPSRLRSLIVGKDAAGNELDAPPEVFAPTFRYLNSQGIENTTFHVGEDFRHLLSGLRAVDEAVTFLEMKPGDRIGHGTALGIPPDLWKKRLGERNSCWCYVGEWLDNLVWLCQILKKEGHKEQIAVLQLDVEEYFHNVYDCGKPITHKTLCDAWSMRSLDATLLNCPEADELRQGRIGGKKLSEIPEATISHLSFRNDPFSNSELIRLMMAAKKNLKAFQLFYSYHTDSDARKRYDELVAPQVDEIENSILEIAQDHVVKKLREKNILVEVMPTSNKRISFYGSYSEHHLMNWLKRGIDSRPVPAVAIASDDPGIFAANLRNEYSHIFNTLVNNLSFSSDEAYNIIKRLHENAKAYAFKSPDSQHVTQR